MTDVGAVVELAQALNAANRLGKEVGNMVSGVSGASRAGVAGVNGGKNGHNDNGKGLGSRMKVIARPRPGVEPDADFSDLYEESPRKGQSANKAPACYQAAMEHMVELGRLQSLVNYHAKLNESSALRTVESAKAALYQATSRGLLTAFHGMVPQPVPSLEKLVSEEIAVMAAMQKQVGMAVNHSEGIVRKLRVYDSDLLKEFDSAKTQFAEEEARQAKTQKAVETRSSQLAQTQMDSPEYVPLQAKLNNLLRAEKETKNVLEILGQQVVDTYKQSSQVRAKEDVVRMGLHELRLVHSYVTRFLTFVQRTRQADDLLPQLVETATAVTDAYQILTGVVQAGSAATTEAVKKLVNVIGTVDYTIMPSVQHEVNKQRSLLERADKKTTFYEQAVELLRGKNYQTTNGTGQQEAAAPPTASALN
ncbi:hypothetical protein HYU16_01275 [Candidatus Woesearchaeota archaeon]|nr:hypothetical protein [Candidatus Woesearchaeota archaeon]